MSREIKFRAYMEDANQDWRDEDSEDRYEMIYDFAYEDYNTVNDMLRLTENLMQYTGLKDSNGVEIYEGDILRVIKLSYDNKNEFKQFVCQVEFYQGSFHLDINKMLLLCYAEIVEVIGNIYENEELLNV